MAPCATCAANNPLSCTSCVAGYSLLSSTGFCVPNVTCGNNCTVCPYGFTLASSKVTGTFKQNCTSCNAISTCARCNVSNTSQCISCPMGSYLINGLCLSCSAGCASCFSLTFCTSCTIGYIPQGASGGPLTCTSCTSPCASCSGSMTYCTSCQSGYTLQGSVCMSSFNFQVNSVFGVNLTQFQANYLSLLNQLASAASTNVQNIIVLSILSGSVVFNASIATSVDPTSPQASTINGNLDTLFTNKTVAGMSVTSYSVVTNGGSIPNGGGGGGLPTSTIIILAVVIPVGTLRTFIII